MRRSIDGFAALIKAAFGMDPFAQSLFLFCGKRCDRLKALFWEGDGFVDSSGHRPMLADIAKPMTQEEKELMTQLYQREIDLINDNAYDDFERGQLLSDIRNQRWSIRDKYISSDSIKQAINGLAKEGIEEGTPLCDSRISYYDIVYGLAAIYGNKDNLLKVDKADSFTIMSSVTTFE